MLTISFLLAARCLRWTKRQRLSTLRRTTSFSKRFARSSQTLPSSPSHTDCKSRVHLSMPYLTGTDSILLSFSAFPSTGLPSSTMTAYSSWMPAGWSSSTPHLRSCPRRPATTRPSSEACAKVQASLTSCLRARRRRQSQSEAGPRGRKGQKRARMGEGIS